MTRIIRRIVFTALAILIHHLSFAQMPDWVGVKDREGNVLFFDPAGKVRTLGKPWASARPVSAGGMEYYINHAEELVKYGYKAEGLLMLKSILAIPASDQNVLRAQQRASKSINAMIRREGTRFEALSLEASPVMYLDDKGRVVLADEHMRFSMTVPGRVSVIRKTRLTTAGYRRRGLLLGVCFGEPSAGSYDALIAVDCEKYAAPVGSLEELRQHWDLHTGVGVDIVRTTLRGDDFRRIQQYTFRGALSLRGFEGFYRTDSMGYVVKTVTPASRFGAFEGLLRQVVEEFRVVGEAR
ncbi:MAG: hypothetical protein JXA20_04570 [Spirochaetes bacterium]|nr:hypothetical protein [Spirochaetota bacterium]